MVAIVGTYRRGGVIDTAVDEILESARQAGAETQKFLLIDHQLQFCNNCRKCTQKPGEERGACGKMDDLPAILDALDAADVIVLASPMNFGTVTAVMKVFIERLICYAYWPWGADIPRERKRHAGKRAIIVESSAAPAFMARWFGDVGRCLKQAARVLGADRFDRLAIGFASREPRSILPASILRRAQALGRRHAHHHAAAPAAA
jgi:NAD(P)H-dependent FMN reductase